MSTAHDWTGTFLHETREGRSDSAWRVLADHPDLPISSIHAAAAAADPAAIDGWLGKDPANATLPHVDDGWPPLLYLCASRLHHVDEQRARGSVSCAEALLRAGADPNSFTLCDPADPHSRIPALYHAVVSNNVPVVELLIASGANVDDGESVYHGAELNHRACLELLRKQGAELSAAPAHWGNTALYFVAGHAGAPPSSNPPWLEGIRWLLEHGANPNVVSGEDREVPLHRAAAGRSPDLVAVLLEHGADPNLPRADGRTPGALAVRRGREAIVAQLRSSGARLEGMTAVDEFLGACSRAAAPEARAVLAAHPDLLERFTVTDRGALGEAASEGRGDSLRLMVALGFDLSWKDQWGATALHSSAWAGKPDIVRLLLNLGAPVNVRDDTYGCSAAGWAAHGSIYCRRADDDYCAVIDALIDAGAGYEASVNKWDEPTESMASPRVRAHMIERAFCRPDPT